MMYIYPSQSNTQNIFTILGWEVDLGYGGVYLWISIYCIIFYLAPRYLSYLRRMTLPATFQPVLVLIMRQQRANPPCPMTYFFKYFQLPITYSTSIINNSKVQPYMPLIIQARTAKWLSSINVIVPERKIQGEMFEMSYNDQIYCENGYLIGKILRSVVKASGRTVEGLYRIRKIAVITSNQNWRILADILGELGFVETIDPENITGELIEDIIQFLHNIFAEKPPVQKKNKVTTIDINNFRAGKPVQNASNLLEFLVLAMQETFGVELQECLGLFVQDGKYFRQIAVIGTSDKGHQPIIQLYKLLLQNIGLFNDLMSQQYGGQQNILKMLGVGVLSESQEVCQLCCQLFQEVDSEWPQKQGVDIFIRSQHTQALDLLFRRLGPNIARVINDELYKRFKGNFVVQMRVYTKLMRYFNHSLFGKQALKCLQITYYITKAFDLFQPDRKAASTSKQRTASRILLSAATKYFDKKFTSGDYNKVLYCFQPSLTQTLEERVTTIGILFDLLNEVMEKQRQFGFKIFGSIWKYHELSMETRSFVMDNMLFWFKTNPNNFPVAQFLHLFEPTHTLQHNQYALFLEISQMRQLSQQLGQTLLQIGTIFYYQQLSASGMLDIIRNVVKKQIQHKWGSQIYGQILNKWPNLHIPAYQPLPPQSKKIKFRSVGLKKRQMMQFTQLNRYKNMLMVLTAMESKPFLIGFGKNISSTVKIVQKSKIKEMRGTEPWLNGLLKLVEGKIVRMRDKPITPFLVESQSAVSELRDELPSREEEEEIRVDVPTPAGQFNLLNNIAIEDNQFIEEEPLSFRKIEMSPLLPFSEEEIPYIALVSQQLFFQNYQNIYIKTLNQKHGALLNYLHAKYKTSINMEHFLKNIGILNYIGDKLSYMEELERKLELIEDDHGRRVEKIIVQAALLAFQFKKSRRVTIKCLESFYHLLEQKNQIKEEQVSSQTVFTSKVQFESRIAPLIKRSNKKANKFMDCFEIVSEIMEKALGIGQVEPVSKIVSQVDLPSKYKVDRKNSDQIVIEGSQMTQMKELQKILENESLMTVDKNASPDSRSTPMRRKVKYQETQVVPSNKETHERWSEVQKKVAKRRKELEDRSVKLNI